MMSAAGVEGNYDREYVDRLVTLFENFIPPLLQDKIRAQMEEQKTEGFPFFPLFCAPYTASPPFCFAFVEPTSSKKRAITPKACLLGLDQVYGEDGKVEPHHTSVHTPNDYVKTVSDEFNHIFYLTPSIHPYRKDVVHTLQYYHKKGARVVKWLPNSMGIDPSSKLCDTFYETLVKLDMAHSLPLAFARAYTTLHGPQNCSLYRCAKLRMCHMILLTHTGHEHSLDDAGLLPILSLALSFHALFSTLCRE